jgi:hypothetical protein
LSRWEKSQLGKDLRRAGLSYGEIMGLIPVKKSTLATWCREVTLTPIQIEALKERAPSRLGIPVDTNRKRRLEIQEIRGRARDQVPGLISDPYWVAGLVLYWAEGTKGANRLSMANTNPRALRLFIHWTRRFLTPTAEFTLHLHLHEGNDEKASRRFWRDECGLPESRFIKTFIKAKGTGHRKNHLPHGVCTVRVCRASDHWNTVMEWIDTATDQFGLTRTRI